jgi:hypothetical protein
MTNSTLRLVTALGALAVTSGCSELNNCPDARETITIDRPNSTDKDVWIFQSSAGWDAFDEFPAKTKLKFKHDLGVPLVPQSFLSFRAKATSEGSFTEAAGNAVEFDCVDSHTIVIENNTCESEFFVKVVAFGSPNGVMDDDRCDHDP